LTKKLSQVLTALVLALTFVTSAWAQNAHANNATAPSVANSLSSLPEADVLIYFSPQRILSDAAPRVLPQKDLDEMRAAFFDIKRAAGVDPATIEYVVLAIRIRKPTADLNFVPPDVLAVIGGDFSSDSILTLGREFLGEKVRDEKYGSRTIGIMTIDEIAAAAVKTPLLKSFTELGAVSLSPNSIAIGNIGYLKAAVDAVEGNGRISPASIQSLLRDPNSLIAATGSPLAAFARSFGLQGTEANPRESRCDTRFGDFYAGVTMSGNNLVLRGAMNTDNPDTAKIINGLLSGLMSTAVGSVPDQSVQTVLKGIKMSPRESEIVFEGEVAAQTLVNYLKPTPTPATSTSQPKTTRRKVTKRRPVRK
jgi:hypothetical protein